MKNTNGQSYLCLIITAVLVICGGQIILTAQAQTNFIHPQTINESQLTQTQSSTFQKIKDNANFLQYNFIKIEDLASFQDGGIIKVNISGHQCGTLAFRAKNVQYYSSNKYTWYGEVASGNTCSCSEGQLLIIAQDGNKFGYLKIDDDDYSIDDIGGGVNVLGKVDSSKEFGCGTLGESGEITPPETQNRGGGNCDIRVLVLFIPAAASAVTNITATATTDVTLTNQAFRNSGLMQSDINLVLAGVVGVTFTESPFIATDLMSFTSPTSTITSTAGVPLGTLIANASADVVMILGKGASWDLGGLQQGFGSFTTTSFAILRTGNGVQAPLIFPHELGHLLGCRHETCGNSNSGQNCDNTGLSQHAHVFTTGCWPNRKVRRTIMFTTISDKAISYFSNPDISYAGNPTGDATHNNSAMIRNSACIMANAVNGGDPLLTAHIAGKHQLCRYEDNAIFEANVAGGAPGPYSYEWQKSSDGVNYSGVMGTDQSFVINGPFSQGQKIFVRVKVKSAGNEISEDFFSTICRRSLL